MAQTDRSWDEHYQNGQTPWDSGLPSRELQRVLSEHKIAPGRALELGCGTGTNAVFLAQQGFEVTAVDCAPTALIEARKKATDVGVNVEWVEGDVIGFGNDRPAFDFLFDRGCYHCCRRVNLEGYVNTVARALKAGSKFLCLTGNADEDTEGPPRLTAAKLTRELEPHFRVLALRAVRFQDAGGADGPLGWSAFLERR